jgi:hypothetical protein
MTGIGIVPSDRRLGTVMIEDARETLPENPAKDPGKRRRPRDSMLLMGTIEGCGDVARQRQPIRIRNLSPTGLMADSQVEYDTGSLVEVEFRGVGKVSGEVVWVRQNRMGITFAASIDPKLARVPQMTETQRELRQIEKNMRRPGLRSLD